MASDQSSPRLLVVEPHRGGRQVMAKRLSEAGYKVTACATGSDALAELHRGPVQLILCELRMAQLSGVGLTRLVRGDSVLSETPIILIAGRSDSTGAVEGFDAGADDVVAKPFHFEVLLARIAKRIAKARAILELKHDNAALDARVITRAIELGETRAALEASEAERRRLASLMTRIPD